MSLLRKGHLDGGYKLFNGKNKENLKSLASNCHEREGQLGITTRRLRSCESRKHGGGKENTIFYY